MKVLVCSDGSPAAAQAARFGMEIARGSNEPIELLSVVEHQRDADKLRSNLEALGHEIETIGAQCNIKIRHGHAAEQILDEAADWQADVIVLGRSGQRGLTRFLMGATAARILQYAACSVLLHKSDRSSLKKILACTAGGEPGLRNVDMAGRVAEHTPAEVTVLHVMSQVALSDKAYLPDLAAAADDLIARETREGKHLKEVIAALTERSIRGVPKVRHGFVVDEVLAELREGNYDLLVIGAHSAHGLTRWLLDDVTADLLEATNLPVLVVRSQ
ncbi:MAG TPA: universal stress protein [Anaerolineae bacterium]|nr:universal stress protein [Anaerolineae bacterium]HZY44550.1 universal stress protein [Anaerolineae bacterium]